MSHAQRGLTRRTVRGMSGLRRFWFTFAAESEHALPPGVGYGVGVTASSPEEASVMISEAFFGGKPPPIAELIEDVDVSTLDAGHVLPNMDAPLMPGIWFPQGYR
jgi:hypothetical protein